MVEGRKRDPFEGRKRNPAEEHRNPNAQIPRHQISWSQQLWRGFRQKELAEVKFQSAREQYEREHKTEDDLEKSAHAHEAQAKTHNLLFWASGGAAVLAPSVTYIVSHDVTTTVVVGGFSLALLGGIGLYNLLRKNAHNAQRDQDLAKVHKGLDKRRETIKSAVDLETAARDEETNWRNK